MGILLGTCSVKNCENPLFAMGFCSRHYSQNRQYGKVMKAKQTVKGLSKASQNYKFDAHDRACLSHMKEEKSRKRRQENKVIQTIIKGGSTCQN